MSERISYEGPDGAVGYITDVTKEDFYKNPKIELYDELEQSCYELVCNFAELIGVKLDREEPDFRLANHIRDTVIELLEKEFEIPFPVHDETDLERDIRIRDAKDALFKLEHKAQYEELCTVVSKYSDVCLLADVEAREFIIDSGSPESLRAIAEELGISSNNIYNNPVCHKAYVAVGDEHLQGHQAMDFKEMAVYLWPCAEGKWNAAVSDVAPNNESVVLTRVGAYPAELYFYRVDINGSGSLECETCQDEKELIKHLNYIGECGYTPAALWGFDIDRLNVDRIEDKKLVEILNAGAKARAGKLEMSLEDKIADAVAMGKKEYSLILCKGEPEEETVKAFLTDQEVALIKKDIAGELNTGIDIELADGREVEIGIIDEISAIQENKTLDRKVR